MAPGGPDPAQSERRDWASIIAAASKNPLGLTALSLLVLMAILSLVAGATMSGDQRFWLFLSAFAVIVAVVLVALAISRPEAASAAPTEEEIQALTEQVERRLQLWFGIIAADMFWAIDGVIENESDIETKEVAWATFLASVRREAQGEDEFARRLRESLAQNLLGRLEDRHNDLCRAVRKRLEDKDDEASDI